MIGLDTNVLVRYITQDDPAQSALATALIESLNTERQGFVSLVSIVELYWVLTTCYDFTDEQVTQVFDILLRSQAVVVDRAAEVLRALRVFEQGRADFADCLIERIGSSAGCEQTLTFDTKAARHAGMTLLR